MLTENIKQLIIEIQQEVSEKFYSFLKKFELTKKNKYKIGQNCQRHHFKSLK